VKVLVCGGRNYQDERRVKQQLGRLHKREPITLIVQGGATGADNLAFWWAIKEEIACVSEPMRSRTDGPARNQRMLDKFSPDLIVAFPGGPGTRDMRERAKAQGFKLLEIKANS